MNIASIFIKRPVLTTLVMLAILLFGIMAYRQLPVSDLPNVDFPTIQVSASLPGASPETMASSVATPLEQQFSTIAGLDSMTSSNTLGSTSITLQFNLSRDLDGAALDVQSMITQAQARLPQNMPSPPSFRKVNPADQGVLFLVLRSSTLPLSTVDDFAETFMSQRISMITGVAQVQIYGPQKYAVHVQVDPRALATRQIGIDEVSAAVQSANVNLPTGTLWGHDQAVTVQSNGQLMNAAAFNPLIVAYRNGSPVRLSEIGRAIDGVENDKTASWFSGERSIILAILRQPGTNTVEVVDRIKSLLPSFRQQIPPAIDLEIMYDRSVSIRGSVGDVKFTLVLALCLVILVIFLFLRNVSATVIPSLALPMSIVGTFAVMYLFNYSLDNLSLMALTLSVGFVVDDAIVMLENIVRHMELGESPMQAALNGSREIGFTIISMTLSLAAVFIPILFMSGLLGRLLHEFAVTIISAVLISGFVSLTLTPMLASRSVKHSEPKGHGRLYNAMESFFTGMHRLYERTLQTVLRHRFATLLVSFAVALATAWLFVVIPQGFFPNEDTGQIFGTTEAAQDVSFDAMREHQLQAAKIVSQDTNVAGFMSSIGAGGPTVTGNGGRLFMRLKPRSERRKSADEIIQELRPQFAKIPGLKVYLQNPPLIRVGGTLSKALYQFALQGSDTGELYRWTPILVDGMSRLDGFQDVTSDLLIANPQVTVEIDRDKASALGVTAQQIEEALFDAYGQRQVSTIYTDINEYWVVMEVQPQYQTDPDALSQLYIRAAAGRLIPLSAVAKLSRTIGPMTVSHLGQLPAVTISFNLRPGVALGTAVDQIRKLQADLHLPAIVTASFQGSGQVFQSSLKGLGVLLIMSILVIYLILGILYESFIHPITILSGLPSAGLGALATLLIFHDELYIYSFVGI